MPDDQLRFSYGPTVVVRVEDHLSPGLARRAGAAYMSPPQAEEQALALVALLLERDEVPDGTGPWRRALPGGYRVVSVEAAPETG